MSSTFNDRITCQRAADLLLTILKTQQNAAKVQYRIGLAHTAAVNQVSAWRHTNNVQLFSLFVWQMRMCGDQTQTSIAGCYIEERNPAWTLTLLILSMEDQGVTIQFKNTEKKCWSELKLVCRVLTVTSKSRVKSNCKWLQLLKVFYIRGMWGSEHAAVQRRILSVCVCWLWSTRIRSSTSL